MADFQFNIAKGRLTQLYDNVDTNNPTNSAFILVPVDVGATTDASIKDFMRVNLTANWRDGQPITSGQSRSGK